MAEFDINSIIILITLFILFGVFLFFDLFKRNEKYGYLAYIVAIVPINYLWYLSTNVASIDVLTAYVVLFGLWNLCMLRDLVGVAREKKEFDDILLFLGLGILVQLIVSAILPEMNVAMKAGTSAVSYFNVPDIYRFHYNPTMVTAVRVLATTMVFLAIIPMIIDIKDEEIAFPAIVIITIIFIPPLLYLGYLWYVGAIWVLTFLFVVILLIILLIITRSGSE